MNKFWQFIKRPRGPLLAIIYFLTAVFSVVSIVVAIKGEKVACKILTYPVYAVAAILLFYSVYTLVIYWNFLKEKIENLLKSNRFADAVMSNYGYKTTLFSFISTAVTLVFVAMNLIGAIKYKIFWYAALSIYYFILVVLRGGILAVYKGYRKKYPTATKNGRIVKWKIHFFVGAFLVLLELSMAVVVTVTVTSDHPVKSGMIMAIYTAAYAFYKMGAAIYNVIKATKHSNPVIQAIRNLNFADACMSIFSLTVLMTATFGDSGGMIYINAATGFFCLAAVVATSSIMIVRADKNLKQLKGMNNGR